MKHLRAAVKLIAFSVVAVTTVFLTGLGNILLLSESHRLWWKSKVAHGFGRLCILVTGMKLKVEGTPPKPPFFLVSNHLSYIDIIPFWYLTDCTFVAKDQIKSWPFFGFAAKVMGILFIDRENNRDIPRVNEQISRHINPSQGLVLFPEGTSTKGEIVEPFRPPLLYYPSSQGIEVSYASVSYHTGDLSMPASETVCWWGDMSFFSHFYEFLKLKSFTAVVHFGENTILSDDRKYLARVLHKKVSETFVPIV